MDGGLGSSSPFILRNYRFITPTRGTSVADVLNDVEMQFKIDGAPVILTYESDLILRLNLTPKIDTSVSPPVAVYSSLTYKSSRGSFNIQDGLTALNPPYRLKLKSLGSAITYCRINLANASFYSVNTPQYLMENIMRKTTKYILSRPDSYTTEACILAKTDVDNLSYYLAPGGSLTKQWDNTSFVSPVKNTAGTYQIDFRIPLTDLLPVFKAGVMPVMLTNSKQFDLFIKVLGISKWFVPLSFNLSGTFEPILALTTVALPSLNPLAELLIKPHLQGDMFRAPFLDYYVYSQNVVLAAQTTAKYDFSFNISQLFKNVPFISLSFLETSTTSSITSPVTITPATTSTNAFPEGWVDKIPLSPTDRENAGFYTLPTGSTIENLRIELGPSAFPLTQWPLDNNMIYLMNRKHFEMYGRRYNESRVCPVSRQWQGDACFFFDLSHGGNGGFQIDSANTLNVRGIISTMSDAIPREVNIRVMLTVWYSNHLIIQLNDGGVLAMQ